MRALQKAPGPSAPPAPATPCRCAHGKARTALLRSRPHSGERSSAARLRSSSRCSTKRPSAIRSITAICSVRTMRSAPATGIAAQLQLADDFAAERLAPRQQDHDVAGRGSAPHGRAARAPQSSQSRIWSATRLASTHHRTVAAAPHPPADRDRWSSAGGGASAVQNSMPPLASSRWAQVRDRADRARSGPPAPARSANTVSTKARISGAERREVISGWSTKACPAPAASALEIVAVDVELGRDRRPGS